MRKTAARVEVPPPPTVADRRRAIRDASGDGPGVKKVVEIDLTKPGARKALTALYPRPESETIIDATPELERAAYDYVAQRDLAKIAAEKKEVAGNVLCNAIAKNKGVRGKGWKAEWDMSKGNVDWAQLAKDQGISDATIAKYRKPDSRGLDVTEVADEG
jgi:hypothetical protein